MRNINHRLRRQHYLTGWHQKRDPGIPKRFNNSHYLIQLSACNLCEKIQPGWSANPPVINTTFGDCFENSFCHVLMRFVQARKDFIGMPGQSFFHPADVEIVL